MTAYDDRAAAIDIALRIQADVVEYASGVEPPEQQPETDRDPLPPEDPSLAEFDIRVVDEDLRKATRTRFVSGHYSDSVEAGAKALNELVRQRTGRTEDGDALMTAAFSPANPLLRIGNSKSKSAESVQRGHMQLCQGVIAAWRNPRAHSILDDEPGRALVMLATIDELMAVTRAATRTRKRR